MKKSIIAISIATILFLGLSSCKKDCNTKICGNVVKVEQTFVTSKPSYLVYLRTGRYTVSFQSDEYFEVGTYHCIP